MKCEYCLAPITLEDKYCPHCGRANHVAIQHVNDMAKYQKKFDTTQKEVMDVTRKYKSVTARIIILGILVIALVVLVILNASSYSLYSTINSKKIIKNKQYYMTKMDEYLSDDDFLGFATFVEVNSLTNYRVTNDNDPKMNWYRPVMNAASNYSNVYMQIMRIYTGTGSSYDAKNIGDGLNYFYSSLTRESNNLYGELESYEEVFGNMDEQCRGLLIKYLDFTYDEASSFLEMSEAKRSVLVEEKVEALKERMEAENE